MVADSSGIFGQPRGLTNLFFTELWERFGYYGMRALLTLFMVAPIARGGLEFSTKTAGLHDERLHALDSRRLHCR
jgi:POT family proton-dependent oligopeptide transporter